MNRRKVSIDDLPVAELTLLFARLKDWAVLRNENIIANFCEGGDCDIICLSISRCEKEISSILGPPLRIARRSYVISYYYRWGHIDLTDQIYWQGLILLQGSDILSRKGLLKNTPITSDVDEAIVLLLNSVLWGGFVKRRYCGIIYQVFKDEELKVKSILGDMVGQKSCEFLIEKVISQEWDLIEKKVKVLRSWIRVTHFSKKPIRALTGSLRFGWAEIKLRIFNRTKILILRSSDVFEQNNCMNRVSQSFRDLELKPKIIELRCRKLVPLRFEIAKHTLLNLSFMAKNGVLVLISNANHLKSVPRNSIVCNLGGFNFPEISSAVEQLTSAMEDRYK